AARRRGGHLFRRDPRWTMPRHRVEKLRGVSVAALLAILSLVVLEERAQPRVAAQQAGANVVITLDNDFIKTHKLRATMAVDFTVDSVGQIHPAKEDGDMHFSGRAPEIRLATVAEIMNAMDEDEAVKAVQKAKDNKKPIKLSGAWRIWCEHAGGGKHVQGQHL